MSTKKGFFMVANEIVMHYLPQLGAVGFMLYCTLRRMTDRNDRCYPSLPTLRRMTGIEEAQLKVALDLLEALQLMQRLQHTNTLNGKQTEVYVLPLYPEILGKSDRVPSTIQSIEPSAQLSLHLPRDKVISNPPPTVKASHQLKTMGDPPKQLQGDNLTSLITLLVEQMRETNHQMGSLIARMDRVIEVRAAKKG